MFHLVQVTYTDLVTSSITNATTLFPELSAVVLAGAVIGLIGMAIRRVSKAAR